MLLPLKMIGKKINFLIQNHFYNRQPIFLMFYFTDDGIMNEFAFR